MSMQPIRPGEGEGNILRLEFASTSLRRPRPTRRIELRVTAPGRYVCDEFAPEDAAAAASLAPPRSQVIPLPGGGLLIVAPSSGG